MPKLMIRRNETIEPMAILGERFISSVNDLVGERWDSRGFVLHEEARSCWGECQSILYIEYFYNERLVERLCKMGHNIPP